MPSTPDSAEVPTENSNDAPEPSGSRRPRRSLSRALIVVLIGLAFCMIQVLIGGPRLVYSLAAYSLLGVAGLIALFGAKGRDFGNPGRWCTASALLLAAYVSTRALFSPVEYLARTDLLMAVGALLVYFLSAVHLPRNRQRRAIVWLLFGIATAHIAVGAVQFKEGNNFMLVPTIFRPDYGARASGFYICPNHLAGLLEMLGLLALGFACWARGKVWQRVLAIYGVVICVGGIAITGSRGAYVSTVIGLVVFSFLSLRVIRRTNRRKFGRLLAATIAGCTLIVVGAAYLMLYSTSLKSRLGQIYDPGNMRLQLWEAALRQFALAPAFGTGSGTYLYFGRQLRDASVQGDPIHVHSDYLEMLAEYGIAGVCVIFFFLAAHLRRGWLGIRSILFRKLLPAKRTKSSELACVIGAFSAVVALLVHSVVDFNLHIPANTLLVAFLFGILATPTDANEMVTPDAPRKAWMLWLPTAIGVLLLGLTLPKIPGEFAGEKARVALRDLQYGEARDWAEKALNAEKKNPDLYYYLGESQHYLAMDASDSAEKLRLHDAAAAAFVEGLRLYPQDIGLLLKLGRTLDNLGRFADADKVFERAIAADPNSGAVYANYGLHWHRQRRYKTAQRYYTRAYNLGERELTAAASADLARDRLHPPGEVLAPFDSNFDMDEDDTEEPAVSLPLEDR